MNLIMNCAIPFPDEWIGSFGMARKIRVCFASGLKRQLRLNDLSQKDFAKKFGAAEATVSRWATAEKMPNYPTIDKICEFFNIDPIELMFPESATKVGPGKVVIDLGKLADESGFKLTPKDS